MERGAANINDPYEFSNLLTDDENKKSNFRFPIVSDHEIYGWDPAETEKLSKTVPYTESQENEEEPAGQHPFDSVQSIPLSENERWPGRRENGGNVYRAEGRRNSIRTALSIIEEPSIIAPVSGVPEKPARRKPEIAIAKNEGPKKFRRPFTPSQVPSPIYGYGKTSPIESAIDEIQKKKEEKLLEEAEPVIAEPSLFASSLEKRFEEQQGEALEQEKKASRHEQIAAVIAETEQRLKQTEDTVESAEAAQPVEETAEMPVEEPVLEEADEAVQEEMQEEIYEAAERETQEEIQELVHNEIQDESRENIQSRIQEESPEEEPEPAAAAEETAEELEEATEELYIEADVQEASPSETAAATDPYYYEDFTEQDVQYDTQPNEPAEAEPAVRQEKIKPFNVLMLSSDKEKLAAKETARLKKPAVEKPAEGGEPIQEAAAEAELPPAPYVFPPLDYLAPPEEEVADEDWLASQSRKLEESLSHFSIQANVMEAVQGPAVTMFELTVEQGTKVSKIRNLTDDLKLALAARDIRIQAPIPGTSMIGIEIPNRQTRAVRISEVIESEPFQQSDSPLEAVLGLSLTGEPQTIDLRKMPHGMIAGATGSGKSVCINSLLISLLYKASYHDLKLLLIDPKMVELAPYNGVPHLLSPVITDVKAATAALKWAVEEMERRYELFAHSSVRNIERYNEMVMESRRFSLKMPYILVVIDELADLMMMAPADVEVSISRITQKARACGIHLIIATQRPSVDVITGTIKANIPTRIAFAVSSQVDSRTILDTAGAERLLGKGDMLYLGNGQSAPVRLQGTFVTDDEIERIIEHVSREAEPDYLFGQEDLLAAAVEEEETDPLFHEACSFIIEQGSASTSALQRHFSIGYNRAAKLIDRMEANQFISEQRGSKPRDVFLTEQKFESFMK